MLFFYLRIFPERRFILTVYGLLAFTGTFILAFEIQEIVQCIPISAYWTAWDGVRTGKCSNSHASVYSHAALNLALDFVIIVLPIPQLLRITTTLKRKIQIISMFAVGFLITIVSSIRLQTLVHYANSTNFTWDYNDAAIWSSLETNVSVFVVCMPSLVQFSRQYLPKVISSTFGSSGKGSHPNQELHMPEKKKLGIEEGHLNSNFTDVTQIGSDNGIYKSTDLSQMTSKGSKGSFNDTNNSGVHMV
jgi:hypothetical protein